MPCKVDHADPDHIPAFLCRACHPELTPTPEQRAARITAERIAADIQRKADAKARELSNAERDLADLEQRDLVPGSTPAKIRDGFRAKVERLRLAA